MGKLMMRRWLVDGGVCVSAIGSNLVDVCSSAVLVQLRLYYGMYNISPNHTLITEWVIYPTSLTHHPQSSSLQHHSHVY